MDVSQITLKEFLSTPSARRATDPEAAAYYAKKFLSTPSARRATHRCSPPSRPP